MSENGWVIIIYKIVLREGYQEKDTKHNFILQERSISSRGDECDGVVQYH